MPKYYWRQSVTEIVPSRLIVILQIFWSKRSSHSLRDLVKTFVGGGLLPWGRSILVCLRQARKSKVSLYRMNFINCKFCKNTFFSLCRLKRLNPQWLSTEETLIWLKKCRPNSLWCKLGHRPAPSGFCLLLTQMYRIHSLNESKHLQHSLVSWTAGPQAGDP